MVSLDFFNEPLIIQELLVQGVDVTSIAAGDGTNFPKKGGMF